MSAYTNLQSDFEAWNKRTDQTSRLSSFVSLFETRANRRLRVREMEAEASGAIDANAQLALPADWLGTKTLWLEGYEASPLEVTSLESLIANGPATGVATQYAVRDGFWQFNGTGTVLGVYWKTIPSLATNGDNWLSAKAYDAYLFGALAEAAIDSRDKEAAAEWWGRCDAALAELTGNDMRDRYSGALIARKR